MMAAKKQPAKFDRCVQDVKRAAKKRGRPMNAYAVCTAAGTRKGKNPAEGAAEAFEKFHGFEPKEVIRVKKLRHYHRHVASAGDLVGMEVRSLKGQVRKITGLGDARLTFNEAMNQLFVTGGDQKMTPVELRKFAGRDWDHEIVTLGKLVRVGYFTDKSHLGSEGGEAVYSHRFRTINEAGRHVTVKIARDPDLFYRVLDQQFEISGGSYTIIAEGIDK